MRLRSRGRKESESAQASNLLHWQSGTTAFGRQQGDAGPQFCRRAAQPAGRAEWLTPQQMQLQMRGSACNPTSAATEAAAPGQRCLQGVLEVISSF